MVAAMETVGGPQLDLHVRSAVWNPTAEEMRAWSEEMPTAEVTSTGHINIVTEKGKARSAISTFVVTDDDTDFGEKTITRAEYDRVAALQAAHLADMDVIVLDGYVSDHPDARIRTRLIVEKQYASLAGMQELLYFPADDDAEPEFLVVYTPSLAVPDSGYPNDRLIAVDLENKVTRVFNSDYFGESKMGSLRMWDALMYDRGGLAMHAGLKTVRAGDTTKSIIVVGLSGTGKTTTTFSQQGDEAHPVQDDFIALFEDGRVYGSEAGTFAKVIGLTEEAEPTVWRGAASLRTYYENVGVDADGTVDWDDDRHTSNTRAIMSADDIEGFLAPANVETADIMLVLSRNRDVMPAIAKLPPALAAAYFMLGESIGTSAGGAAEAGKFLRVVGTNPFFVYRREWQANHLFDLMKTHPLDVYVMNTGRVGGAEGEPGSVDVTPAMSSAIVEGIVRQTIEWRTDPDFGYDIAVSVPGIDDTSAFDPAALFAAHGREAEYQAKLEALTADRRAHFANHPDLYEEIASAI